MKINPLIHDCYSKQSPNDVARMKGDRSAITTTYDRYDPDTGQIQMRTKGSLRLLRRDITARKLSQKYREFAELPYQMLLGSARSIFGVIGINELRQAIRGRNIYKEEKWNSQKQRNLLKKV